MKHIRLIIIFCVTALYGQNSRAAERSVHILDMWSGQPLAGVRVVVAGDTLRSDDNGWVRLPVPGNSSSRIHLQLSSYFDSSLRFDELKGPFLYMLPVQESAEITVIAPRTAASGLEIPAHISRLSLDGAEGDADLYKVLDGQAGLVIKSYGGSGQLQTISLRGMAAEQTQILLDGIPLNSLQLGSSDLGQYTVAGLGAVDIYRGGNAIFGGSGAIGGTINLRPRKPAGQLRARVRYQRASFKNQLLAARLDVPLKKFRQSIEATLARGANDYSIEDGASHVRLRNRDFRRQYISWQTVFDPGPALTAETYFSWYKNRAGAPRAFTGASAEPNNQARTGNDNTLARLKISGRLAGVQLEMVPYLRNEWMDYRDPALVINNTELHSTHFNQEQGVQTRARWLVADDLLLMSGAEGSWQKVHSSDAGRHSRRRLAWYALSEWQVWSGQALRPQLRLNASLRLESYSDVGSVVLPAAGLNMSWSLLQVYFSSGRNYRAPTFNDLYWQPGGNGGLRAEKAANAEIGFDHQGAAGKIHWKLHLGGYRNRVKNQIKWLPSSGNIWRPQNIASVYSRGVEFEARIGHVNNLHQLSFNYTYGTSEKNQPEFPGDPTVGNQLPWLPREQWMLSAESGLGALRVQARLSAMSFRYRSLNNDPQDILPAHTTAAVSAFYSIPIHSYTLRLRGMADNIFDLNYEVLGGYPMPGRNYSFDLILEFNH